MSVRCQYGDLQSINVKITFNLKQSVTAIRPTSHNQSREDQKRCCYFGNTSPLCQRAPRRLKPRVLLGGLSLPPASLAMNTAEQWVNASLPVAQWTCRKNLRSPETKSSLSVAAPVQRATEKVGAAHLPPIYSLSSSSPPPSVPSSFHHHTLHQLLLPQSTAFISTWLSKTSHSWQAIASRPTSSALGLL